ALRQLDELRIKYGRLDAPIPVGTAGGTLHVELNHTDPSVLPAGFRTDSNDSRILACALNLQAEAGGTREIVLVTKDMPLRVKAASVGLAACWVLGGIHGAELGGDPARIEAAARHAGLAPLAAVPAFVW
ncbi:MAG: hypothetical protein J0H91_05525, partial [Rhodospirillales bacterium]|nr:hypothetical protein [Rhodospirillales bacterium]